MESLLSAPSGRALAERFGRERAKEALRLAAQRYRRGETETGDVETLIGAAAAQLGARAPAGPVPVINATGVLLHTNLGRAPLAEEAVAAVVRAAGFCALEYDLATGQRGKRGEHVRPLLLELFAKGEPDVDALAVTNTAAALLLALDTVANGRPVAVSRGEMVAIGGDFRVPAILAKSGASLFEVGTTNKTTPADYRDALDAGAAAILKVRPSNYRVVGFTEEVALTALAELARPRGAPIVYDAGAAAPRRFEEPGLRDEPVPLVALRDGADLVCFSGDKTLGGPQAGLLLGRKALVGKARDNPLSRALRPDKLVLAALAATLELHLSGREGAIPFFRMLKATPAELRSRAAALADGARGAGLEAAVVETIAVAGGGAGTESTIPSVGVALSRPGLSAEALAGRLRQGDPPLIARIEEGRVVLDLRTMAPEDDQVAVRLVRNL